MNNNSFGIAVFNSNTGVPVQNLTFVSRKQDFPDPVAGVITLEADRTYFITSDVDLEGDRLVGARDTTLLGASSENCSLTSTGLGVGVALFTTEWTTPIRHITFKDVDTALAIDGSVNPPVALDWTGVNFTNVPNIGTIDTCDNWIFSKGAFLSSQNLVFTGSVGTIGVDNTLFVGSGSVGNIIHIDSNAIITRRFRIIYSSLVVFGSTVGINVDVNASGPVEGYILDTINFSGNGTYTAGVTYLDNKSRFDNSRGIINTAEFGNYFMNNNSVVTVISGSMTPVKIEGVTTPNSINQKFEHDDNKLTYEGAITRDFQISATASFVTGNNQVIGIFVAKNGIVINDSVMYATTSGSGRAESITVQTITELEEGDYIEMWIENDTSTNNITVEYLNVICKSIN